MAAKELVMETLDKMNTAQKTLCLHLIENYVEMLLENVVKHEAWSSEVNTDYLKFELTKLKWVKELLFRFKKNNGQ